MRLPVLAAIMVSLATPLLAVGAAQWRAVNAETGQIRELESLEQLARDFPDSGSVRLRMLQPLLEEGQNERLLEVLAWLKLRGYVFRDEARQQIPELVGDLFAARASALLLPPPVPVERSSIAWTLPEHAGLIESVMVDEERDRVLATSVTGRALWGLVPGSQWRPMLMDDADNLSGIAYDAEASEIWVAAGNIDASDDPEPLFSGLIVARPGKDPPRIEAPAGVVLSDLHIGPDGTVYASDPLGGGVYTVSTDRDGIETLIAPGTLRSPQGLAVSRDGTLLYVSDYRYGIAIVDLASREVTRLGSDLPVLLDGTDALFRRGNSLIAIQNGMSPMRISQFDLSEDGRTVVGHTVLEQAHSEWTEPLSGFLGSDALYYIGNGQWDRWVKGVPAQNKPPRATQIRRLPLDP